MSSGLGADEAIALAAELEVFSRVSILGFWYPRAVDPDGGYRVGWDARGRPGPDVRGVVSQARLVYVFARAARDGIRPPEMLAAAEHGFRYLRDVLWDDVHGGFRWRLDDPRKVAYGHAFAVYGLTELVRAGGPPGAARLATDALDALDDHLRDPDHGGYREVLAPDWSPSRERSPIDRHDPDDKLVNTHLHLLEAMTAVHRAGLDDRAEARVRELVDVLVRRARRRRGTPMTDSWSRDWHPRVRDRGVRYGHLVELAWMLLDARDVIGPSLIPSAEPVPPAVRALVDEVETHGVDPAHGGIWREGRPRSGVVERSYLGWAQAEALLAYTWMLRLTGEPYYADRLRRIWAFIRERVADHTVGEWHEHVDEGLRGHGPKGSDWKAGYHATRALLDGAEQLRRCALEVPGD